MSARCIQRTSGGPESTGVALQALQEVEPRLPVTQVTPLNELAANTLRQERLVARLTTVLGLLALGLACLGLYGLMSYAVKQRTAELGIRFALGAPRARVLWMVFRESLTLVAVGLAIGLPVVAVVSRLIGTMLFEVSPNDPATVAGAMLVLLIVGASSKGISRRGGPQVDPLTALRAIESRN